MNIKQRLLVWAVATPLYRGGYQVATAIDEDGTEYPDVYSTKAEAQQEVADLIAERLILFREDATSYGNLETALDCGFEVVEASIEAGGMVLLGGALQGQLPPAVLKRTASAVHRASEPATSTIGHGVTASTLNTQKLS